MRHRLLLAALALASLAACQSPRTGHVDPQTLLPGKVDLVQVAESRDQWTGVAVSHTGRIFVNYPRWSANVPVSVAELRPKGGMSNDLIPVPFPDNRWQLWSDGKDPKSFFVCVQSVVVDAADNLWVVDAGSPNMAGVVKGGAKLVKIDLHNDSIAATYPLDEPLITPQSYVNDIRIDTQKNVAYLTDSGAGAILVLNLSTGAGRRLLANDPSTHSEHIAPVINNQPFLRNGSIPDIHSDGIALSSDGQFLYYHALTARTLYRIPTAALLDEHLQEGDLARQIQPLGKTGPCDGMEYDADGRIFLSQLERNAVARYEPNPSTGINRVETLVSSPALQWPDSFAVGPHGALYVTASQINLGPNPASTYKLFKLVPHSNQR